MTQPDKLKSKEGWIYLIQALETNRYKIGRTKNIVLRKQQLTKQSPYPLKMLANFFTLNAVNDEKMIHKSFSKNRAFGEWFEFDLEDVKMRLYIFGTDSKRFWLLSNFLILEIEHQLNKLCLQDWGEERRLIREELMTLVRNTISQGNTRAYDRVINRLIPQSLNKCYFCEYQHITGSQMSSFEYILGTLTGINLAMTERKN